MAKKQQGKGQQLNKNIVLLLGSCVLLLLVGPIPPGDNWANLKPIDMVDPNQEESVLRQSIANKWLTALNIVVDQTKDPEAMAVRTFVFDNCNLGIPNQDTLTVLTLRGKKKQGFFSLVALLAQDQSKGAVWQAFYNDFEAAAIFVENPSWPRMIIVRDDVPFTQVWAGLALLHEARHAMYHAQEDLKPVSVEERLVHQFIHQQIVVLGGPSYLQLLQSEALKLHSQFQQKGYAQGNHWQIPSTDPGLDLIWGKALSKLEYHMRVNTFWVQVNFLLVDQYYQGDKDKAKEQIIVEFYQVKSEKFDPRGVP